MATKKSKSKVIREEINIDITKGGLTGFAELAEENGLFRDPNEHSGEGLPDLEAREKIDQWQVTFDIRASYDHTERKTFLEVAQPGLGTYHSFPFEGIGFGKPQDAINKFNNGFVSFLINYGISALFESLYWERGSKAFREESYDAIIESFENYFKSILKPKRKREIGTREINPGLRITTYESIESGREPKTEAEREKEKKKFISDVFAAFKALDQKKGSKRTQYTVAMKIFDGERKKARKELEKAIGNRLRKFGLNWRQLQADYEQKTP